MTYNGSVFIPTQTVIIIPTDANLQALSSKSSIIGGAYFSEESGLYYFNNSILNFELGDLIANDNGGIYKKISPNSFLNLNGMNLISLLNLSNVNIPSLTYGDIFQGNSSNQAEAVTISGAVELAPEGVTSIPLTSGNILQGNINHNAIPVTITGIVSLAPGGITSIPLTSGNILQGNSSNQAESVTISGAISLGDGGIVSIPLTSGNILQGNSSNQAESVTISGDITLSEGGITSITDGSITSPDLNSGISYVARIVLSGNFNVSPSNTPLYATVNIPGLLTTDLVVIYITDTVQGSPPYLTNPIVISDGNLRIYFDSDNDPGVAIGSYEVYRLTSA